MKKFLSLFLFLVLALALTFPVFAETRASIGVSYIGPYVSDLKYVGQASKKDFPIFAESVTPYFAITRETTSNVCDFTYNGLSYTFNLPAPSNGYSTVNMVIDDGTSLKFLLNAPGSTFAIVYFPDQDYYVFHGFALAVVYLGPDGQSATVEVDYTQSSRLYFDSETFMSKILYSRFNTSIANQSFSIPKVDGIWPQETIYSQPCLTRWGYWARGFQVNIFDTLESSPLPVLMRRQGNSYYVYSCRYADYANFRLSVVRESMSVGDYIYRISANSVYSVFEFNINSPTNWSRISINNPAGELFSVTDSADLIASSYPISFADNIDNVFFWKNPRQFVFQSTSPHYIPPLDDSLGGFDDLEGSFLENAEDILTGFADDFFLGLENNLSAYYAGFNVWSTVVTMIIGDKLYWIYAASLTVGVIMLLLNLFIGVFKPHVDRSSRSSSHGPRPTRDNRKASSFRRRV